MAIMARYKERVEHTTDWPLALGLLGLALFSLYAAAHVALNLFALESWWWAALGGLAFVSGEIVSFVTIVFAQGDKLQRTAAVGAYAVFFAFSGFMQSQYFGAKIPQSPFILGWWTAVCGLFLAFEVALALRGHQEQLQEIESEMREHQHRMDEREQELRSQERLARMKEKEETGRQLALVRMQSLQPLPQSAMHTTGKMSLQERRNELKRILLADPNSNLQVLAAALGCSGSTLSRDARAISFVFDDGKWQQKE